MTGICAERLSLGAFVLGALEPVERADVESHLAGCAACRDELMSLAPLAGLLRHTPFDELPAGERPGFGGLPAGGHPGLGRSPTGEHPGFGRLPNGEHPGLGKLPNGARHAGPDPKPAPAKPEPEPGPRVIPSSPVTPAEGRGPVPAPAAGALVHSRRRLLVRAGLAAATAAAAVSVIVVRPFSGGSGPGGGTPGTPAVRLAATDPHTHVAAKAALTPKAWGTSVRLTLTGLPPGVRCRLVVHASGGRSETAGSWASGYTPGATVPASTSVSPQDITGIDVVTDGGDRLVRLRGAT